MSEPFYAVFDTNVLVSGNLRHFPKHPIVVTPRRMLEIIEGKK